MKGSKEKEAPKPAFEVGDIVKLKESFATYVGERATVTAVRPYALNPDEFVFDVELIDRKQEVTGGPVFFANVAAVSIEKAE